MFQSVEAESTKTKQTTEVSIRLRRDGIVIFYGAKGEPRLGVRENPKTVAMFEAIELARADAVPLEVEL